MAAGNDQANGGHDWVAPRSVRFQKNGVNVAFQMIHADQRLSQRQRQRLCRR